MNDTTEPPATMPKDGPQSPAVAFLADIRPADLFEVASLSKLLFPYPPGPGADGGCGGGHAAPPPSPGLGLGSVREVESVEKSAQNSIGENGVSYLIHEHKSVKPCQIETYDLFRNRVLGSRLGSAELVEYSGTVEERRERHSEHHTRALEMAEYLQNIYPSRAERLRTCGAWLQFRDYYSEDQIRLTAGQFCHQDKLCPLCACRRAGRMLRLYLERVRAVLAESPELRSYLVTLTVVDGPDLDERTRHLQGSYREMIHDRNQFLRNRERGHSFVPGTEPFALCAVGGVASVEVKRGENSELWHPHIHGLWLCEKDKAPYKFELSAIWKAITGDSWVVDVTPFYCNAVFDAGESGAFEQMGSDFCEVFKYALAFGDMPLCDNLHAFEVLHGRRLIEAFGVLRGIEIPENLCDEPLGPDLPYIEVILRYVARERAYRATEFFHVDSGVKPS